jgi:hypothetical protein
MKKFIIYLFLFFILFKSTIAIRLSYIPLQSPVLFKPNSEFDFIFWVSEYGNNAEISIGGDLAEYVTLSNVSEKYGIRQYSLHFKFPEYIGEPGIHTLVITAKDIPAEKGMIGGVAIVKKTIKVKVLYSSKIVDISFDATDANVNEIVYFYVSIKSQTQNKIDKVSAIIDIFDINNEKLDMVVTNQASLESAESVTLTAELNTTNYLPAEYKAVATVFYDDNKSIVEDSFKIGDLDIKIINYTRNFKKNSINKFDIEIESGWNNIIKNVYAEITIDNTVIKTPFVDLEPWQRKILSTYWNTNNVSIGEHKARIVLFYHDKVTIEKTKVFVEEKKDKLSKPKIRFNITYLIVGAVIVLVIFNIILLLKLKSFTKTEIQPPKKPKPKIKPKKTKR